MKTRVKLAAALTTMLLSIVLLRVSGYFGIGFVIGLMLTILYAFDLGQQIRDSRPIKARSRFLGALLGVPQALFGLICAISGLVIIGWVLYNSFIERQPGYSGGFLSLGIAPLLVLFGLSWLSTAFRAKPMRPVIHFHSTLFDASTEPVNPINPVRGWSLLEWFRARVAAEFAMSEPEAEDWGWYSHMDWRGRTYLLGACSSEGAERKQEWVLQFDKKRSFSEWLLGQARMTSDDPCFLYVKNLIERESAFTDVFVHHAPA